METMPKWILRKVKSLPQGSTLSLIRLYSLHLLRDNEQKIE